MSTRFGALPPEIVEADLVAPGFIDVHTHDDQIVLADPTMLPKITQGVTTVVVGNCGISLAPLVHSAPPAPLDILQGPFEHKLFSDYVRALGAARPALNAALHLKLPVCSDFRTNFHAYSQHYGIGWLRKPIAAYLRRFHNLADCTMVPSNDLLQDLCAQEIGRAHV